jgi:hypothetical protein
MGIGFSIFLLAIGAILTFAVHTTVAGISISAVGIILMVAGALGLILTMFLFSPMRRNRVTRTTQVSDVMPAAVTQETIERTV